MEIVPGCALLVTPSAARTQPKALENAFVEHVVDSDVDLGLIGEALAPAGDALRVETQAQIGEVFISFRSQILI